LRKEDVGEGGDWREVCERRPRDLEPRGSVEQNVRHGQPHS